MELGWLWMRAALTLLVACYVFVFKFLRSMNGWYYDLKLRNKKYPLPPGDMGWPLIGNFLAFLRDFSSGVPDSFLNNIVSKYGRGGIYKTHLFGHPNIIVSTPELCRKVLTDDEHFKISYPKSIFELIKSRQFFNVEEHKRFRRLILAPIMGQNAVAVYMQRIEEIVTNSLEGMAKMKHPVKLFTEATKVSFSVILHVIMGSEKNNYSMIFNKIEHLFAVIHKGMFGMAINLPCFAFHKALKARRKSAEIIQLVIEVRREMIKSGQQKTKKDIIDVILEAEDESGRKLEDEDIIDLLIALVFGGQMTTAGGMMWTIIYLLENPKVLKKAKEEQEEIMKARPPSRKQLDIKEIKHMVYLAKVINEMLRRATLAFAAFREATVDMNIDGYFILKGWKVVSWIRAIHMDPEYYQNPEEFNPSRWDDHNAKVGAFLPFGIGSRFCPGSDLAKLEITIFLHYFLLGYKFERVNPECPISYLPAGLPADNCLVKVFKIC